MTLNEDYVNQFEQIQPGTFRLGNATKEHSGKYVLEEYRDDGQIMRRAQVHLKIQGMSFFFLPVKKEMYWLWKYSLYEHRHGYREQTVGTSTEWKNDKGLKYWLGESWAMK